MGQPVSRLRSVCSTCGTPYHRDQNGGDCPDCKPKDDGATDALRGNRHARGYGNVWARLSKRARKLQPFCADCGNPNDLTADHSTTAWERHAQGKPIRLQDVEVVCRRCNSERGAARGENANDKWRKPKHDD